MTNPTTFKALYQGSTVAAESAMIHQASAVQAPVPDAQLPEWTCPNCGDTIKRNHARPVEPYRPCQCQRQAGEAASAVFYESHGPQVLDAEWQRTGVTGDYLGATFENFKPRKGTAKALKMCQQYADEYAPGVDYGLWLYGPPGTGKTHLVVATIRALLEQYEVCPVFYPVVRLIRDIKQRFDTKGEGVDPVTRCLEADVLVLDDLAQEHVTSFTRSELFLILDERTQTGRPTFLTSNSNDAKLKEIFNDAFVSRLYNTKTVHMPADDYRAERFKQRMVGKSEED